MSVDNSTTEPDAAIDHKSVSTNGGQVDHINGVSNGYPEKHKSSHKSSSHDKHRSKDKDREKSKDHKSSSSKHHSSSSSRDKDKHSSSKDKERSHSHKSSNRNKDKEKSDKEKSDKERSSDKEKSHSKDHKSSSGDKKESSSSSHKDKSDKEKSKHKHSSSSKDHDRKDDKHSSKSKDKDRHHRDKDKERSKDKSSKHRESSSKSKTNEVDSSTSQEVVPSDNDFIQPRENSIKEEIDSYEDHRMKIEVETQQDTKAYLNDSQSSCDYSMSQFRDEVKEELPQEDEDYEQDQQEYPEEQGQKVQIKNETEDSDEDIPLKRSANKKGLDRFNNSKRKMDSEDEEDVPISQKKKTKSEKKNKKAKKRAYDDDDDDDEYDIKPAKTKSKTKVKQEKTEVKTESTTQQSPTKRKKKVEEEQEVWKWWEEEKKDDGTKWKFLEHKGPLFAPPYERLPPEIKFFYDGKEMALSENAEEVACFYAKMLTHDYTNKPVFNENFFKDWRKTMTEQEKSIIKDLKKCDFRKMNVYFTELTEKNKQRSKEEKLKIKEQNEAIVKEYGFCKIDGHTEKIGNFRIEPPGLFRGRGEHPKMGMVKKRVRPEDVLLNCSKDSVIPVPPKGHRWKEVRHDNTVTWLASWTENVQGQVKYIMLNPSSKLKGEKDWQKYETARKLAKCIQKIRDTYTEEWKAKEMKVRQRAVALYFIDRLALRAGNEKDEDQADTVGCCSLRVEHIQLHKEKDGKEYVVVFDFLGKDSIRYYNEVPVEKRVFKNLELFKENKREGDDLFDRLNTTVMNEHLRELMEGLTAKVFRTYNASITLQNQLKELTDPDASLPEKILAYNRANRAVAILCNHQRAVPKSHDKSMTNLREKMNQKREQIEEMEQQVRDAAKSAKRGSVKEKMIHEKKNKALDKLREQLKRMEVQETDRDENKTIALGTSKLNYLDPRISVAWCKKYNVPIEKIYNKTQRDKFRWAIDMATEEYIF